MQEQENYKDIDGNDITLEKLVKTEPEWAANVIRKLKSDKSILTIRLHELYTTAELVDEVAMFDALAHQLEMCRSYFRRKDA